MTVATYELDINKILMGVIVSLLSWNVYTTHQLSIDLAVLGNKVENLEEVIQFRIDQTYRSESNERQP
jgi:hypothetical protein